jgi:hypothetical protein
MPKCSSFRGEGYGGCSFNPLEFPLLSKGLRAYLRIPVRKKFIDNRSLLRKKSHVSRLRGPFPFASGNMAKNWAFIFQMRMSTPGMPIDISTKFRFFDQQGIESLPGSWVELARTVISRTISPDLTDIDILANAYFILMEKGPSNEIMTEALKILLLWQDGLSIS